MDPKPSRIMGAFRRRLFTALTILTTLTALSSAQGGDGVVVGAAPGSGAATSGSTRPDWLLDPTPYVSEVRFDERTGELTLTNGLAERRIATSPNASTISLRNLTSGEEYIRALSPEGQIVVDGEAYPVGGLTGAPVQNYFKEEWLPELKEYENAYRYAGFEVGEIEARFPYKKRTEWLSREVEWPPKGKTLRLFFKGPKVVRPASDGAVVFREGFDGALDAGWRVRLSAKGDRTSVTNEGKPGEIYASHDVCAYIERDWPSDAAACEVTVDVGDDDYANSWGPGFALLFHNADGFPSIVSAVARPASTQYELCVDGRESLIGDFDRANDVRFLARLEREGDAYALIVEAREKNGKTTTLGRTPVAGLPTTLRVGKVGKAGRGTDYPGAPGDQYARCHMKNVTLYAELPASQKSESRVLPDVEILYEIYDGLPLLSKRLFVRYPRGTNGAEKSEYLVDKAEAEELRLAEPESTVERILSQPTYNLSVFSDYVFGGVDSYALVNQPAFRLDTDPDYTTQVNYRRLTPCLLRCAPEPGPSQIVDGKHDFGSNTIYELLFENTERERRGLAIRRAIRTLAPWVAENPLMFHKVKSSPAEVRDGIEQCRETGFEVLIMSFGSGFNLESRDREYWDVYRELSAEARASNVALGGYSLTSSRSARSKEENVENPSPAFGVGPCLAADWGREYLGNLKAFMEYAEFGVFENDGPYPGDYCASVSHSGHRGKEDSVWSQWQAQSELYRWCRERGIYVNQPDAYFLVGGNKTSMGYRETNWSLPRAEQVIVERQNIYDGTWTKLTSQGWMFVPLSQYHGGGDAATIEPLKDHLDHYDARFANLIGAGVQACWRGPRLYDAPETKEVVLKWTRFYKANRRILDGDLIHIRRATGRDWDGWVKVDPDPAAQTRALAFFYNPTPETIRTAIPVPLYYAGLEARATVRVGGPDLQTGDPVVVELNARHEAVVDVEIPAGKYAFVVVGE